MFKKSSEQGGHKARFRERFGFVRATNNRASKTLLLHCVSVGEVNVAAVMVKQLQAADSSLQFAITTTTETGSARVKALFAESVHHFYLPYDLPFAMANMLKRINPSMVIITEVELWPNLIHQSWLRETPVVLVNARMTDKSTTRYGRLKLLFNPILNKLAHVCAQGQRDYNNYCSLGLETTKLTLTNNLKFDMAMTEPANPSQSFDLVKSSQLTVVGASTHEGEESALLHCQKSLLQQGIEINLILVPRHPERFEQVATWLTSQQQNFLRSSTDHIQQIESLMLVDEMGKLNDIFTVSDIAFVGGSLVDRGGHNALEAAAHNLPVVMGSYIYNNPEICKALSEAGALYLVKDNVELNDTIKCLIEDANLRRNSANAAKQVLQTNVGAAKKSLNVILKYLH